MIYGFSKGDLVWCGISRPKMGVVVGFDSVAFGYLQAVLVVWIIELNDSYRFLAEDCRVVDPDIKCPGELPKI